MFSELHGSFIAAVQARQVSSHTGAGVVIPRNTDPPEAELAHALLEVNIRFVGQVVRNITSTNYKVRRTTRHVAHDTIQLPQHLNTANAGSSVRLKMRVRDLRDSHATLLSMVEGSQYLTETLLIQDTSGRIYSTPC